MTCTVYLLSDYIKLTLPIPTNVLRGACRDKYAIEKGDDNYRNVD